MSGTGHSNGHAEPALAVIAVGMSAGALRAFRTIVSTLPRGFRGAIVVAHHVAAPSLLPALIWHWAEREAVFAHDGDMLREGVVHVCPPEHHVAINADGTLAVSSRDRLANVRPSIDWLFESAAASYGDRALALVLSGANSDGARGVVCIARAGGAVIVQEPTTCERPQMTLAAIATGRVHARLDASQIAAGLVNHVTHVHAQHAQAWDPFGPS